MAVIFLMAFGLLGALSGIAFAIVSGFSFLQILLCYTLGGFVAGMAGLVFVLAGCFITNFLEHRNCATLMSALAASFGQRERT
ncbi:MAG: hypothetical protein ACSHWY_09735 [Octadecabacter sp.]